MTIGRLIGMAVAVAVLGVAAPGCGGEETEIGGVGPGGECDAEHPCDEGTCVFPPDSCALEVKGTCQSIFQCDGPATGPVCGCDGQVLYGEYASCDHRGERTSGAELCAQGTFTCGDKQCTRHVEVCVATSGGPVGSGTSYECVGADSVPNCLDGIADCGCLFLEDLGCADGDTSCCSSDADHQETITIALP